MKTRIYATSAVKGLTHTLGQYAAPGYLDIITLTSLSTTIVVYDTYY